MNKWLALMCSCLALGLVVAGCGSDNKSNDSGSGKAKPAKPSKPADNGGSGGAAAGGGAAKGALKVQMKNIAFNPASVTVKKGGTVTWTNEDSVPHDVTKENGPGPDFASGKGNLKQGDTYKQTFKTAGKIDYVCTIHPNMTASVTVK